LVAQAEGLADVEGEVLIVDDNPLNLKLVRVLLAGEGYIVHTTVDAEQTLQLLERVMPDVILMDVQLPGMDGLELTRRIKADPARRDITILALTAYAMKGDDERARAAGADGYLMKPVDTRTLPDVIADYIAKRARN
jgi:CheY-like chemotaxis protein